jgi:tetratricopeptide (TPR) repeat protein
MHPAGLGCVSGARSPVGWFAREKPYDRTRILADASRARKKGKHKKAIALYRQVLAVEPDNPELLRKVAPVLAEAKRHGEAWASYHRAAERFTSQGFAERAIGVYREASGYLPTEVRLWRALSDLELKRDRPVDALNALLEGRGHFRSRRTRQQAVFLLLQARKIDPSSFEANFDLADLLARSGVRDRAKRLLEELIPQVRGQQLRQVRARLFRISPTPAAAGRWLRALGEGRGSAAHDLGPPRRRAGASRRRDRPLPRA